MSRTKYHNAWRKAHSKYRNARRKSNYKNTAPEKRVHKPWGPVELLLINNPDMTDASLSRMFERSVQAIQQKRYILKRNE